MVRVKNRYLVFQIKPRNENNLQVTESALATAIKYKIQQLHGDFGVATATASFYLKYCNKYTNIAIIKSRHGPHKLIASCLPFITQLNKKPVDLHILYIGATIKQCLIFIKNFQQDLLVKMSGQIQTDQEKLVIKEIGKNLEEVSAILGSVLMVALDCFVTLTVFFGVKMHPVVFAFLIFTILFLYFNTSIKKNYWIAT